MSNLPDIERIHPYRLYPCEKFGKIVWYEKELHIVGTYRRAEYSLYMRAADNGLTYRYYQGSEDIIQIIIFDMLTGHGELRHDFCLGKVEYDDGE